MVYLNLFGLSHQLRTHTHTHTHISVHVFMYYLSIYLVDRVIVLVVMWSFLAYLLYKTMTMERGYVEWDPYEILQIDRVRKER